MVSVFFMCNSWVCHDNLMAFSAVVYISNAQVFQPYNVYNFKCLIDIIHCSLFQTNPFFESITF